MFSSKTIITSKNRVIFIREIVFISSIDKFIKYHNFVSIYNNRKNSSKHWNIIFEYNNVFLLLIKYNTIQIESTKDFLVKLYIYVDCIYIIQWSSKMDSISRRCRSIDHRDESHFQFIWAGVSHYPPHPV